MRRRVNAIIVAIGFIGIIAGQVFAAGTIKVGYWVDEPQVIASANASIDKHPKGAAVDYWEKYIAQGMGVDVEWVGPMAMDRLQKSLEDGSIDAVALLGKNPERADKFLYPAMSLTEVQPGLAVLKSNPLNKIEKVADISNLKIGYMSGALVTPFMKDPSIKFDLVATTDQLNINMQKLLGGRVDAVYSPEIITLKYEFAKRSNSNNFKFLLLPEKSISIYSVFSKKANPEFLKKYESINEKSKANYNNLLKQYVN